MSTALQTVAVNRRRNHLGVPTGNTAQTAVQAAAQPAEQARFAGKAAVCRESSYLPEKQLFAAAAWHTARPVCGLSDMASLLVFG